MKEAKIDVLEDMQTLLIKNLSIEFAHIKQLYQDNNYHELLRHVHKLHGAVCYCNVPFLRSAIIELESALKQQKLSQISELFTFFEEEVTHLLNSH